MKPRRRLRQLLACLTCALVGCAAWKPEVRHEIEEPHMGLPFRLVLYTPDGQRATNAARAAFQRIAALNRILSDYESDSELSRLSRTSGSDQAVPLSEDLAAVLRRAAEISEASDGAFDITIGPAVQLWKRARRQRALPVPADIEAARASVGWRRLILGRDSHGQWTATLKAPAMRLDLGGIAKGYALDEAADALRRAGVQRFLISGGGDMVAGQAPPGAQGWRIEVGRLDLPGAPEPSVAWLQNEALTTSGDAFQRLELGGVRYSHIVDPRTCLALTNARQVTIIAADAMTADALSTAVCVLEPGEGLALATRHRAAAVILGPAVGGHGITRQSTANWESRSGAANQDPGPAR
jgi:FAD:protein FMN transferase